MRIAGIVRGADADSATFDQKATPSNHLERSARFCCPFEIRAIRPTNGGQDRLAWLDTDVADTQNHHFFIDLWFP